MSQFTSVLLLCLFFNSTVAIQKEDRPGLLVMAHGGEPEWNQAVNDAVLALADKYPVSVAFGMADPVTLQAAIVDLERLGATSIGVVRMFISGRSFLHETQYAFGLRSDAPTGNMMNEPKLLDLEVPVMLSEQGLMDVTSLGGILADRAMSLSNRPERETALIIGHGPGSDIENEEWLRRMDLMADSVRSVAPFRSVQVRTLREDWTGKREVVEVELRQLVSEESDAGNTVLIIPFRLFGFGPYADVFEGLEYRADSTGFLPDQRITDWIDEQFRDLTTRRRNADSEPKELD